MIKLQLINATSLKNREDVCKLRDVVSRNPSTKQFSDYEKTAFDIVELDTTVEDFDALVATKHPSDIATDIVKNTKEKKYNYPKYFYCLNESNVPVSNIEVS